MREAPHPKASFQNSNLNNKSSIELVTHPISQFRT